MNGCQTCESLLIMVDKYWCWKCGHQIYDPKTAGRFCDHFEEARPTIDDVLVIHT